MTKKKVPHHHLVVGPTDFKIRCYGRQFDVKKFKRLFDRCDCLSHRMSRLWLAITHDSYIVHAVPVVGARGVGSYLSSYLKKDMYDRTDLESIGFGRRFSTSRGWPGNGRLRLAETLVNGWESTDWQSGTPAEGLVTRDEPRIGNPEMIRIQALNARRGAVGRRGALLNVENVRP